MENGWSGGHAESQSAKKVTSDLSPSHGTYDIQGQNCANHTILPLLPGFSSSSVDGWVQILAIECSGDLLWENSPGTNLREGMLRVTRIKKHSFCSYTGYVC